MTGKNDFQAAIEALEARRKAIDIAIAELKSMSSKQTGSASSTIDTAGPKSNGDTGEDPLVGQDVRSDTFFNLSIPDAARKFLLMVKRPKDTRSIGVALKKGGNLSTSKNFEATVHSASARNKGFIRVKREWGLAEWYPSRKVKTNGEEAEKPKKTKKPTAPKKNKEPLTE